MKRRLALLLFLWFSLSILGISFHHHEDGDSHDDCPLCVYAVCQCHGICVDAPQVEAPARLDAFVVPLLGSTMYSPLYSSPYSTRAPPSLAADET
jgi:hypothetical protein